MELFGTDGIRGRVLAKISAGGQPLKEYFEHRHITPELFTLIGESIATVQREITEREPHIVIGWDERSGNRELTRALTLGLISGGCHVTWAGEVATPGLQACVLEIEADLGCMITASHNPEHDSGLKLFDSHGFKSFPSTENQLSRIVESLSKEDRDFSIRSPSIKPKSSVDGQRIHLQTLSHRLSNLEYTFGVTLGDTVELNVTPSYGLLMDSSRGPLRNQLAAWLSANGLRTVEVSSNLQLINDGCGAGMFSPTDFWTWKELEQAAENHILLSHVHTAFTGEQDTSWEPGQIVAAALDGDGDRCFLLEVLPDKTGIRVVDGDMMADDFLRAADVTMPDTKWLLASSVESDLGLITSLPRFDIPVAGIQTAVGDRWLSASLTSSSTSSNPTVLQCREMPNLVGCEDSGHLVLPIQHPRNENQWGMVGDGAMTLCATLLARCVINSNPNSKPPFNSGWKKRQSVTDVDRSLWDGQNQLSEEIVSIATDWLTQHAAETELTRLIVPGSSTLLLLEGRMTDVKVCLGVRNSGTEEKISVSLRLAKGWESVFKTNPGELVSHLCNILSKRMRH